LITVCCAAQLAASTASRMSDHDLRDNHLNASVFARALHLARARDVLTAPDKRSGKRCN
jgi:hypothetical protein